MGNVGSLPARFDRRTVQCKVSITAVAHAFHKTPSSNDTYNLFTAEEKRLLRKTWSQLHQQSVVSDGGRQTDVSHDVNRGVRVFLRIFELEPQAQSVFSDFQHVSRPSDLIANPVFRSHAKRFMTAVDMTVHSLDALDVIVAPTLVRLGRHHVVFPGFHVRYMAVFERAMDDAWRADLGRRRYSGSTRRAWRKLFRFLTTSVAEGYNEALSEIAAVQSASIHTDLISTMQQNY